MIVLQEMIGLYASLGKKNFDLFHDSVRKKGSTKLELLFKGIESGTIKDDATAHRVLYGEGKRVPISTYNSLKMRFFRRITDSLFFIDTRQAFTIRMNRVLYDAWKNTTIVRILSFTGANRSAEYLAAKTLKVARKYQFTAEASQCCLTLSHGAALRGDQRLFEKFAEQTAFWEGARVAEQQSEIMFARLNSWYAANWSLQQENLIQIANYISEIEVFRERYNTHKLNTFYFQFRRIYAEVEQNYEEVADVYQEVEQYLKKNPQFFSKQTLGLFAISAMSARIWCGDFAQAYRIASRCEQLLAKGKINWFYFQEPHLILALRSGNYELARKIFREVITHPRFNRRDPITLEKWRLLEFYVRFITGLEFKETLLPADHLRSRSRHRHYRAFSATLSTLSKDLTGYNVVGVFAQILYLLHSGDRDGLVQRDESLQTFRRKRLGKLNYRLAIFAKLIHVMVECGFDPDKTQRRAAAWIKKLSNVPPKFKGGTAETLEIIPLEELWNMLMAELRKRVQS